MLSWLKKKPKAPLVAYVNKRAVPVPPGASLLDAALAAGLDWRWQCRVGSCGACRCKVESGQVKALTDFSYILKPEHIADGIVLACQTQVKSDIAVSVKLRGERKKAG